MSRACGASYELTPAKFHPGERRLSGNAQSNDEIGVRTRQPDPYWCNPLVSIMATPIIGCSCPLTEP